MPTSPYQSIKNAMEIAAMRTFQELMPNAIGKFQQVRTMKDGESLVLNYECDKKPQFFVQAYLRDWGPIRVYLIDRESDDEIGTIVINTWEELDEKVRSFVLVFGLDNDD